MDDDDAAFSFDGFSEEAKLEIGCWEPMAPIVASQDNFRSWEMVSNSYHDCSIFPPNLHEGLHVSSNPDQILAPSFPSPPQQIKGALIEQCLPERHKEEKESCLASNWSSISAHGSIVSWFEVIRSKVLGRGGSAEAFGVGICSCAALAGLAGFFMYLRHRHRREKEFLLFLIQEKNQCFFEASPPCEWCSSHTFYHMGAMGLQTKVLDMPGYEDRAFTAPDCRIKCSSCSSSQGSSLEEDLKDLILDLCDSLLQIMPMLNIINESDPKC